MMTHNSDMMYELFLSSRESASLSVNLTHPTEVIEMAQRHPPAIVLLNGDLTASDALEIVWLLRYSVTTVGIIVLITVSR